MQFPETIANINVARIILEEKMKHEIISTIQQLTYCLQIGNCLIKNLPSMGSST